MRNHAGERDCEGVGGCRMAQLVHHLVDEAKVLQRIRACRSMRRRVRFSGCEGSLLLRVVPRPYGGRNPRRRGQIRLTLCVLARGACGPQFSTGIEVIVDVGAPEELLGLTFAASTLRGRAGEREEPGRHRGRRRGERLRRGRRRRRRSRGALVVRSAACALREERHSQCRASAAGTRK